LTLHAETHQVVGHLSWTDTKINACQVGSQNNFQPCTRFAVDEVNLKCGKIVCWGRPNLQNHMCSEKLLTFSKLTMICC